MNAICSLGDKPMIVVDRLEKRFILHTHGSAELAVLDGVALIVHAGECVALNGPSGSGKSTLLRLVYGNYRGQAGSILMRHEGAWVEIVGADPRTILQLRRRTIGYVSQFLRAIPRVPALDVVAEPLVAIGTPIAEARERAGHMLARLNIAEPLWRLSPATFSGGEQQRVNVARGFVVDYPILLLDEPTASLDAANRAEVMSLIEEARQRGAAIVGIFHDRDVREAVATRLYDLSPIEAAA